MSIDRHLQDIVALLSNCLDAYTAALFLRDPADRCLVLRAYHSLSKQIQPGCRFSVEDGGLIGWVAKNREALNVDHFERNSRPLPYYQGEENIKALLAAPLPGDQGVVCVDSKRQYTFTAKEQKLLHGFATVIGNTIGLEQVEVRLAQLRRLLSLWHRADALPAEVLDPAPFFDRLLTQGCAYLGADGGLLALPADDGNRLQAAAVSGDFPASSKHQLHPPDQGIIGWIFANRKPLVIPRFRSSARIKHLFGPADGYGQLGSVLGMPLAWNDEQVGGVIAFFAHSPRRWHKEDVAAISAVVRRATLVLHNFTLERELALLRNLDPTTELCTAAAFERILAKRLRRCQEHGGSLGVAVLMASDLHRLSGSLTPTEIGALRRRLAAVLVKNLRPRQTLAGLDFGGFAFVCEDTSPSQIENQLAGMQEAVRTQVLAEIEASGSIAVRAGYALYPRDGTSARQLWISAFNRMDDP